MNEDGVIDVELLRALDICSGGDIGGPNPRGRTLVVDLGAIWFGYDRGERVFPPPPAKPRYLTAAESR